MIKNTLPNATLFSMDRDITVILCSNPALTNELEDYITVNNIEMFGGDISEQLLASYIEA